MLRNLSFILLALCFVTFLKHYYIISGILLVVNGLILFIQKKAAFPNIILVILCGLFAILGAYNKFFFNFLLLLMTILAMSQIYHKIKKERRNTNKT